MTNDTENADLRQDESAPDSEFISGVRIRITNPSDFRNLMRTFLSAEIHQW